MRFTHRGPAENKLENALTFVRCPGCEQEERMVTKHFSGREGNLVRGKVVGSYVLRDGLIVGHCIGLVHPRIEFELDTRHV